MHLEYTLALCEGGLAQLGALKTLYSRELLPKRYFAYGIGAVLAALLVCGWKPDEIEKTFLSLKKCSGVLLDIDFNAIVRNRDNMIYGRRIEKLLYEFTHGVKFQSCGNKLAFLTMNRDGLKPVLLQGQYISDNVTLASVLRACLAEPGVMPGIEICGMNLCQCRKSDAIEFASNIEGRVVIIIKEEDIISPQYTYIPLDNFDDDWMNNRDWKENIIKGELAAQNTINQLICLLRPSF